jgi:hypothetical protein
VISEASSTHLRRYYRRRNTAILLKCRERKQSPISYAQKLNAAP